jgi:hypothetical protein
MEYSIDIILFIKIKKGMGFNIFKKKKARFLGRGGLIFIYEGKEYLVDSEMSFSKDIDIVVYKDSIQLKDKTTWIEEVHKKRVFDSLLEYLKNEEHLQVKVA